MNKRLLRILLVEDDPVDSLSLERLVREQNLPYRLQTVSTLKGARQQLKDAAWDLVLLDYQLPDGGCFDLFPEIGEIPVVVIIGPENEHEAVQAMRRGASDYIIKRRDNSHLALLPFIIEHVLKRKQAEDELVKSEHRYKSIVETVPDMIFQLSSERIIVFVNSAVRSLGYEPSEMIGRHIEEFVCLKKDEELFQLATKRWGERATKDLEVCFKSRSGSLLWQEMKVSMLAINSSGIWDNEKTGENKFLGTQCVARDITERKKMELALLHNKEKMQSLLSNAMDGIITIRDNGIIELFNPAAERIFGYAMAEVVGKSVNLLMPEPHKSEHDGYIQAYLRTGQAKILGRPREVIAVRKNGEEFPIELSASEIFSSLANADGGILPLDGIRDNPPRMFIGIIRDITERKQTEDELKHHRENLEDLAAKRTAELNATYNQLLHAEKLTAMGKLSASIAHEFNNPIYGIRNVLEQVNEGAALDETYKKLVAMAIAECNRIADLTRKLQNFYSPSSSMMAVLDLHEVIDDITFLYKKSFMERKIILGKRYASDLPPVKVIGDQIKQVILNIIQNAEEAIPEQGGTITITTESTGKHIKIHVNDTGSGISPAHRPNLFDPFFSTKPAIKGTGLGLSVSYGIIKKHGGEIQVASEPGNTTFTLILPIS